MRAWPVGGGGGDHLGLTTLRTMGYDEPNGAAERWGNRGQTSTQVVELSSPIGRSHRVAPGAGGRAGFIQTSRERSGRWLSSHSRIRS